MSKVLNNQQAHLLSTTERRWLGAMSFACLIFGMHAYFIPAIVDVKESDRFGFLVKLVSTEHYRTDVALLMTAVAIVIFCFAINGARLSKFTIGSASVETQSAPQEAKEFAARNPAALQTIAQSVTHDAAGALEEEEEEEEDDDDEESPAEVRRPTGEVIEIAKQKYQVYEGTDVPIKVLAAMFAEWPAAATRWQQATGNEKLAFAKPPKHLSDIQFAARRAGKGNFPWLITFFNAPPIRVALGGKGKPGGTVDFTEEILRTTANTQPAGK